MRHAEIDGFVPTEDRILIKVSDKPDELIKLTDAEAGNNMLLREGVVISVGPGKHDEWGYFNKTTIKAGQIVMFNARWNDFRQDELKGSGSDFRGPLERPLPYWANREYFLVRESDIAGMILKDN